MTQLPILAVMVPLGAAFALPLLVRLWHPSRDWATLAALAGAVGSLAAMAPRVIGQGLPIVYWAGGWGVERGIPLGISLTVDAFGLVVALAVTGLSALVWLYAIVYLARDTGRERYAGLHLLLTAALVGFVLSGDLFNQFIYLEIMSVAAYALTGFRWDEPEGLEAAFKYLVVSSVATFFIAIGLALVYAETGALNLAHAARELGPGPAGLVGVALLLGGYATKAGLVPWHMWLPDTDTAAPASFGALSSGATLKIGIYALARIALILAPLRGLAGLGEGLLAVGGLSIAVGGLLALAQSNLRRVLAFSSISQVGYILIGIALASPAGLAGATFHIVNHALFKGVLFLAAGAASQATAEQEMRAMGGLFWRMPVIGLCFLAGALAVGGVPPFNGYVSKLLIEEAARHAGLTGLEWLMIAGSVLTLAALLRAFRLVFLGEDRSPEALEAGKPHPLIVIPQVVLVLACLGLGAGGEPFVRAVVAPAAAAAGDAAGYRAAVLDGRHLRPAVDLEVAPWEAEALALAAAQVAAALALLWLMQHYLDLTTAGRRWGVAYALDRALEMVGGPLRAVVRWLRAAHSGLVNDYVLWNAAGTALLALFLVLFAL